MEEKGDSVSPSINEDEIKKKLAEKKNVMKATLADVVFNGQTFGYILLKQTGWLIGAAASFVVAIALSEAVRAGRIFYCI